MMCWCGSGRRIQDTKEKEQRGSILLSVVSGTTIIICNHRATNPQCSILQPPMQLQMGAEPS